MAIKINRSSLVPANAPAVQQNITPRVATIAPAVNEIAQIADEYYAKVDETESKKMFNDYRVQANQSRTSYLETGMEDAHKGIGGYKDSLTKIRDGVFAGVANERQERMLLAAIDQAEVAYLDTGYRHAAAELGKWKDSESKISAGINAESAVASRYTPKDAVQSANLGAEEIDYMAKRNGFSKKQRDAAVLAYKSETHSAVLVSLITDKQYDAAREYLNNRVGDKSMKDSDQVKIRELLDKSDLLGEIQEQTGDIWEASGGDLTKALESARNIADPEVRKGVVAGVKARHVESDAAYNADFKKVKQNLNAFLHGGGNIENMPPEWKNYFTQGELVTKMNNAAKLNGLGGSYLESENDVNLIMAGALGDIETFLDEYKYENYYALNVPHRGELLNFVQEQEVLVAKGEIRQQNPKNVMLQTSKQVVDDLIKGTIKDEKTKSGKKKRQALVNTFREVLSQYVDEKEFERDQPEFREKVRKIAAALLIEDNDRFGDREGFIFERLGDLSDNELAQDFWEDLDDDIRQEVGEAAFAMGVTPSSSNLLRIYLRSQGVQ